MRAPTFAVLIAAAGLAAGAKAHAGATNPAILLNQIGPTGGRPSVSVPEASARTSPGGVAVAPVPAGATNASKARVTQPMAALDRCEAILKGRAPPVEGLDCSAGQLEKLREQVDAEAAARPSQTVDVDTLADDIKALGGGPEQTDPTTGAPAIVILTPGQ